MAKNATALIVTHDPLSIVPNSRILQIENNNIKNDFIATEKYCNSLKRQYLHQKSRK
jgi:hypothetical protein